MLFSMVVLASCGTDDATSTAASCEFHSDCEIGTSCNFENECVSVGCENCQDPGSGLVCLVNDQYPDGVCSRPECSADDECDMAAGESCQDGVCATGGGGGCQSAADCDDGETCNLANECVPDEGGDTCTSSADCGDGEFCDTGAGECAAGDCFDSTECPDGQTCSESNTCEDGGDPCGGCSAGQTCNTQTGQCEGGPDPCGGCPSGQTCNTSTSTCEPNQACDPACGSGEVCNATTGQCEETNCPPGTPSPQDCQGDPVYNKFDPDGCFCAECLADSDCDTGAGETCNSNGECFKCTETCNPSDGGNACSQPGFYCVSDCCVECIGNADCGQGEVCVDGSCGAPPDCSVDPTVCTGGTVCNQQTQTCEPPDTGQTCSGTGTCPQGSFCNTQTGQCESMMPGGGGSCDPSTTMCNSDCTCPGNSTCEFGMLCAGCQPFNGDCPSGQICFIEVCISF